MQISLTKLFLNYNQQYKYLKDKIFRPIWIYPRCAKLILDPKVNQHNSLYKHSKTKPYNHVNKYLKSIRQNAAAIHGKNQE